MIANDNSEITTPEIIADDIRGQLIRLFEDKNFSVLYATSKSGSVRANHYHKEGSHYCYITKGGGIYYSKPVHSNKNTLVQYFKTGDLIYSGPMMEHKFVFAEDSEFITISPHSREQKHYEDDLVRIEM